MEMQEQLVRGGRVGVRTKTMGRNPANWKCFSVINITMFPMCKLEAVGSNPQYIDGIPCLEMLRMLSVKDVLVTSANSRRTANVCVMVACIIS